MDNAAVTDIYNYRGVDERLATSGQPTQAQIQAIADGGFTVMINLALHDDPRYSLPDEAGLARACGLEYVHIPVQFKSPAAADLAAFFTAMDAHADHKVWVHCAANMRVTAFLGLYRRMRLGWTDDAAFALMRDVWQPDGVWSAFIEASLQRPA